MSLLRICSVLINSFGISSALGHLCMFVLQFRRLGIVDRERVGVEAVALGVGDGLGPLELVVGHILDIGVVGELHWLDLFVGTV